MGVRVVVTGHICVDLLPELPGPPGIAPGRLFDAGPLVIRSGGCVGNTGLDLAALGTPVRLVADVGDDELGRLLCSLLDRPGVDPAGVVARPGARTSYSVVIQPPDADRTFWHYLGANRTFDGADLEGSLRGADLVHVGYPPILPTLYRNGAERLLDMLAMARTRGLTTSVDLVTVDPRSAAAREDWAQIFERVLPDVDVFAPSVDDLASLVGLEGDAGVDMVRRQGDELIESGAAVVMLKAGEAGLYFRTADVHRLERGGRGLAPLAKDWANRELWAPSIEVTMASTAAAGDAAVAGLLHGIAIGVEPVEALTIAATSAATRIEGHGALPSGPDLSARLGESLRFRAFSPPGWVRRADGIVVGPANVP